MPAVDNRIIIQGRIGKEPTIRDIGGDRYVAHTTLAYTARRRQGDEFVDGETSWFRVTAWNKQALVLAKIPVGTMVMLDGKIEIDTWETEAGEKRETVNLTADRISLPLIFADAIEPSDRGITITKGRANPGFRGVRKQEEPF